MGKEKRPYLMESEEEEIRLELKTDPQAVRGQATWAGISPGMLIADLGCGPGIVPSLLFEAASPGGEVLGLDYSPSRIAYANKYYAKDGLSFALHDIRERFTIKQGFDLVWARFVLEYNKSSVSTIIANATELLRPGGRLCLLDLDYNCLTHYPIPERLENTMKSVMSVLETKYDFDPYVGRKLYTCMYDMGYKNIEVNVVAHHAIMGPANNVDLFNWSRKVEMVIMREPELLGQYPGGIDQFRQDFHDLFKDPRRFTYTPLIMCKGEKPL